MTNKNCCEKCCGCRVNDLVERNNLIKNIGDKQRELIIALNNEVPGNNSMKYGQLVNSNSLQLNVSAVISTQSLFTQYGNNNNPLFNKSFKSVYIQLHSQILIYYFDDMKVRCLFNELNDTILKVREIDKRNEHRKTINEWTDITEEGCVIDLNIPDTFIRLGL